MSHGTLAERSTMGRQLQNAADRWWWAPLILGILWFVIAWLVLRANTTSLATVGVLVGIVFLVSAFAEAVLSYLTPGGWKALHIILTVLFVFGAVWSFVRPVNTFFALASILGLLLFLQGAMYIVRAVALRDVSPYWGLTLFSGILIAGLGIWVSASDRVWTLGARAAFVLLWVGLMAIFRGISDIVLAFELRRVGKDVKKAQEIVDSAGQDMENIAQQLQPPLPSQRQDDQERHGVSSDRGGR